MTDSVDPSRTTVTSGDQDPPQRVPPFVCALPCTKPTVKYGARLDGCASGIHPTPEDMKDLHVLYGRMADVVLAKDAPLEELPESDITTPVDKCAVCVAPIVTSPTCPVIYLESCIHYFHYYCLEGWRCTKLAELQLSCPLCRTVSCRTLLWPRLFGSAQEKNQMFQLQRRCFGLDVPPGTIWGVGYSRALVWPGLLFNLEGKIFSLRKNPETPLLALSPPPSLPVNAAPEPLAAPGPEPVQPAPPGQVVPPPPPPQVAAPPVLVVQPEDDEVYTRAQHEVTEPRLIQVIQDLHLADQPKRFYLGDILPLEENPQYQALYGVEPRLAKAKRRDKLMLQFWCPFDRLDNASPGQYCSEGEDCEFFHSWPQDTPALIKERVIVRQFPGFFCLRGSRLKSPLQLCSELIRLHSKELVHCTTSFHPTFEDVKNVDKFAAKLANQLMSPVVVPESSQPLVCSFCAKSAEPNSIWLHMQNCSHCLHVDCLPLVREQYRFPQHKQYIHCATCKVPSVRTIAWPGAFRSNMVKKTIFARQLAQFKVQVLSSTQVSCVQVDNQANVFTLDYGARQAVTIDWTELYDLPNRSIVSVD